MINPDFTEADLKARTHFESLLRYAEATDQTLLAALLSEAYDTFEKKHTLSIGNLQ